jgi:hypothetical protein
MGIQRDGLSNWLQSSGGLDPLVVLIMATVLVVVAWRLMAIVREVQAEPALAPHTLYEAPRLDEERRAS